MEIVIDRYSGFCAGVIKAIQTAESYLEKQATLYCLGDIVHNNEEVNRLSRLGLEIITHEEYRNLRETTVLIRAHGEPPEIYDIARKNSITLIDATCPVVLNLQQRIKRKCQESLPENQVLIFGKKGHAEVIGLLGQTGEKGMVISSLEDVEKIDFSRPAVLYSQTTQSLEKYEQLVAAIKERYHSLNRPDLFQSFDTICRLVANRSHQIKMFAKEFDKIIFVSGEKSSNGIYLFQLCKESNPHSYFISHPDQIKNLPIAKNQSIGICGATSTPMWLMEEIKELLS